MKSYVAPTIAISVIVMLIAVIVDSTTREKIYIQGTVTGKGNESVLCVDQYGAKHRIIVSENVWRNLNVGDTFTLEKLGDGYLGIINPEVVHFHSIP